MKKIHTLLFVVIATISLSGCGSQKQTSVTNDTEWTQLPEESAKQSKTMPGRQGMMTSSWEFDGEKWQGSSVTPACPEPLVLQSPVDMTLVSGILYPGQYRGGNYKPHGGFRFDGKDNNAVTVTAPFDATLTVGSRYIEQGEIQYVLWFENACGIAYRFDHLLTLTPEIQKLVDTLPAAKPDDSRTTRFATPMTVKAGDVIATAVGFAKNKNVSVDWGV